MSRKLLPLVVAAALAGAPAMAEVPEVSADIAPVHSLVARVMEGVGKPALIVPPGASPHEYSLRPSEAEALQAAELVFWVGPALTPWLGDAIGTLAADAEVTTLFELESTKTLPVREGALFAPHDHDGQDAAHGHEVAAEGGGPVDPHIWLSPDNAAAWLDIIAAQLTAVDPENAGAYAENAAAGKEELEALRQEVGAMLKPVRSKSFIVFHDAYQYFEHSFGFTASGAIAVSDATEPSPARIAEIRGRVAEEDVGCILTEPQFSPGIVSAAMEGSEAKTAVLDPLGSDLEPGAGLYPALIRGLARTLADCL